MENQKTLETV